MNGCHYTFLIDKKIEADKYEGHANLVCNTEGKTGPVTVTVTNSTGGVKCQDTIPAQNGIGPIYYEDMTGSTPTDVTVNSQANNIANTTDQGLLGCGISKGAHTGVYTGNTTVRAFNTGGEAIDSEVSG